MVITDAGHAWDRVAPPNSPQTAATLEATKFMLKRLRAVFGIDIAVVESEETVRCPPIQPEQPKHIDLADQTQNFLPYAINNDARYASSLQSSITLNVPRRTATQEAK